jgi:hypothetical protein
LGAGLALDLLLLVAFAIQHSVMARPASRCAGRASSRPPLSARPTCLPRAALARCWHCGSHTGDRLVGQRPFRWCLCGVALAGWTYLFAASFAINHFELFGLQQAYQALRAHPLTPAPFLERWMYASTATRS